MTIAGLINELSKVKETLGDIAVSVDGKILAVDLVIYDIDDKFNGKKVKTCMIVPMDDMYDA